MEPQAFEVAKNQMAHNTQALSSKTGGGESLVTSVGKAVDLRCIIIHVIIVGLSHFSHVI